MAKPEIGTDCEEIGFFLVPRFSMMAFTSAVEPLRAANRLSGRSLYSWRLISTDGAAVAASNGITVLPHAGVAEVEHCATVAVCAGVEAGAFDDRRSLAWLRRLAKRGTVIGAISTGTWVLAKAGLLQGHRCTIHWEELPSLAEAHPELDLTANLFEIDTSRFTCSGGTAALDLMLHMIGLRHGHDLATAVSEQFIHTSLRDAHDAAPAPPHQQPQAARRRRADGKPARGVALPGRARQICWALPASARTPLQGLSRANAVALLSRPAPRSRASAPDAYLALDHGGCRRLRLHLGGPFLPLLRRPLRLSPAGGAPAAQAARLSGRRDRLPSKLWRFQARRRASTLAALSSGVIRDGAAHGRRRRDVAGSGAAAEALLPATALLQRSRFLRAGHRGDFSPPLALRRCDLRDSQARRLLHLDHRPQPDRGFARSGRRHSRLLQHLPASRLEALHGRKGQGQEARLPLPSMELRSRWSARRSRAYAQGLRYWRLYAQAGSCPDARRHHLYLPCG